MKKDKQPVKPNSCWVLTREHNEYDQFGNYFEAVWVSKPTIHQLADYFQTNGNGHAYFNNVMGAVAFLTRLLEEGGGRQGTEDVWYNLEEVEFK